jgi:anti-sigma factor RsiW
MIARRHADMLAYVDDCMEPSRRIAFEELMSAEPGIKRQIEEWRRQNDAIRAAFAPGGERTGLAPARHSANENARSAWMPQPVRNLRRNADARPALCVAPRDSNPLPHPAPRSRSSQGTVRRKAQFWLGVLVLGFALLTSAGGDVAGRRAEAIAAVGIAAYRTYALGLSKPVEFATSEGADLSRWFSAQLTRVPPIPDFSAFGLKLIGGRIIPGARVPAAFVVYESRLRDRLGLIMEPLDAPRPVRPEALKTGDIRAAFWPGAGHSFALIGKDGEIPIADLARSASGQQISDPPL